MDKLLDGTQRGFLAKTSFSRNAHRISYLLKIPSYNLKHRYVGTPGEGLLLPLLALREIISADTPVQGSRYSTVSTMLC